MLKDEILNAADLPLQVCRALTLFSHRSGRTRQGDTRHLPRAPVHEGGDVRLHRAGRGRLGRAAQQIVRIEEEIFQGLGIPYRVIDTPTGDLGGPAYRKFDLEAWMPGRGDEYGEVTSASNCTDYQARRLGIRCKSPDAKGTQFVHTLNGTAVAVHAGDDRDPGELPASGRQRGDSRSAAAVCRRRTDRTAYELSSAAGRLALPLAPAADCVTRERDLRQERTGRGRRGELLKRCRLNGRAADERGRL